MTTDTHRPETDPEAIAAVERVRAALDRAEQIHRDAESGAWLGHSRRNPCLLVLYWSV